MFRFLPIVLCCLVVAGCNSPVVMKTDVGTFVNASIQPANDGGFMGGGIAMCRVETTKGIFLTFDRVSTLKGTPCWVITLSNGRRALLVGENSKAIRIIGIGN